ncbi:hypothetical protein A3K73_02765 [Candidatus Pacearchaeota archaeon RBG_13_36_9]|nr:MAG: hypothetical protein A3K73_02765 [Candidatus Pacearchaeota archaeon RBG_13_36_9]
MGDTERRVYRMSFPQFRNKHLEAALFTPQDFIRYRGFRRKLPRKWILTYQNSALSYFKRQYHPERFKYSGLLNFYITKNLGFVRISGIGSPFAVTVLEELIALGGKEFLNIGTAGGLQHEGIFLCDRALRDEGTSHHYISNSRYSYPNLGLTKRFGDSIAKQGLGYETAATWTIDAPYRETISEIERYKRQGIATVEMEASALFAVAKLRKVKIASAFVVSDVLSKEWGPKFHTFNVRRALNKLIDAGVECLR